jgi:hypothetical protein
VNGNCARNRSSLIRPIKDQTNVSRMLFAVFIVVACCYYALVYTAIVRFPPRVLQDPEHDVCVTGKLSSVLFISDCFLPRLNRAE